MLNNYSTNTLL